MAILPTRRPKHEVAPGAVRSAKAELRKITSGKLTWYDFGRLGDAEVKYLQRTFPFHPLDIEDLQSANQRPKLDEYENYIFLIFHVPFYDRRTRRLVADEVNVFIGQDYVVTVHAGRNKVLRNLFEEVKSQSARRTEYMGNGSGFLLYELISRLFEHSFPMLDKIAERIDRVEREILEGNSREMTEELSHLKLEIINFRRIIRPQRAVVQALEEKKKRFLPERLDVYFDDVLDALGRTADLLENYKEVAESLEDTNETVIQHRTNNVVKVLTIVSLLTLPGASISGLLAMNLKYPFPVDERLFFIAVAISVFFAAFLFIYMYFKKWL